MKIITLIFVTISGLSLLSIIVRRPWTILIARRRTPPEVWSTDLFLETNSIITGGWTILFAMAALQSIYAPIWCSLILAVVYFLLSRLSPKFGTWYSSKRLKSQGIG
jgi:hypothetical protein